MNKECILTLLVSRKLSICMKKVGHVPGGLLIAPNTERHLSLIKMPSLSQIAKKRRGIKFNF